MNLPVSAFSLFFSAVSTAVCTIIVHTWWDRGLLVDRLSCCTLLYCCRSIHQVKPLATRTDTYGRSCDIKTQNPAAPKAHPLGKAFFSYRNPMDLPASRMNTRGAIAPPAYGAAHRGALHLPAGISWARPHASTSLLRMSTVVLCYASIGGWRSRSLKYYLKVESTRDRLGL